MFSNLTKIRIVTLDAPIRQWNSNLVRQLFNDMIQLKLDGYQHGFEGAEHGVLPLDGSDFYGMHQLICAVDGDRLVPLMAYKSAPMDYCEAYNHQLPIQDISSRIVDQRYSLAVDEFIEEARQQNQRLSYDSALTISPHLTDVEQRYEVLRIFVAIAMHHLFANEIDRNIITATLKFKTEKTFLKMGCKRLSHRGEELPPVSISTLSNEEVLFFTCDRNFTLWARRIMKEYQELWDERLIITPERAFDIKKAA